MPTETPIKHGAVDPASIFTREPTPEVVVDPIPTIIANNSRKIWAAISGGDVVAAAPPAEPAKAAPPSAGTAPTVRAGNPLATRSLRGSAAEFERRAANTRPLLGDICMAGHATMLYAPPNAGKTLITLRLTADAVAEQRIAAGNVYYINADDGARGLAEKMHIMDELGAHTLVPGFKGFNAPDLIGLLRRAIELDAAMDTLVVIDTLTKFAQLMDKKLSAEFANVCRQYVMRGGAVVALAHTTKSPNADGSLRYSGTTDFIEDFDAAYVMKPLSASADAGGKGGPVPPTEAPRR